MKISATKTITVHAIRESNVRPRVVTVARPSIDTLEDSSRRAYEAFDYAQWQIPTDPVGVNKANLHQTDGKSSPKSKDIIDRPSPNESVHQAPVPPATLPAKSSAEVCVPLFL
jgi:hypothetical protein